MLAALGTSRSDPVSFLLSTRLLRDSERQRLRELDTRSLEGAVSAGIEVVEADCFCDSLRSSPGCPPALFAWGETGVLAEKMVAIVGTRGASTYGKAVAQKFAEAFASAGLVVVSGGAMGIDSAAHEGALAVGGRTVAALANGVDIVQPPKNAALFRRIREHGCLVSPFAVGRPAQPHCFRPRNELIAAMSLGVVVIEAPQASGSLMTSTAAADLGREVFVVPGTIDRPGFRGSHQLVRDGATLVDDPSQVMESLGVEPHPMGRGAMELTAVQEAILGALTVDPQSAEKVIMATGLDTQTVLSELTLLELDGVVVKTGTGYAVRP